MDIFIQDRRPKDSAIATLAGEDIVAEACRKWFDVRAFGAVLISSNEDEGEQEAEESEGKKTKKGKKEKNGKGKQSNQVLGPVVFDFAESLDPVEIVDESIICSAPQNSERGDHNVGKISFIRFARLRFGVYVEAFQAAKTGFSLADQEVLEQGLMDLYRYRRSAGRPNIRTRQMKSDFRGINHLRRVT